MLACRAIMYQPTISEAANILTDTPCGFFNACIQLLLARQSCKHYFLTSLKMKNTPFKFTNCMFLL